MLLTSSAAKTTQRFEPEHLVDHCKGRKSSTIVGMNSDTVG